MHLAILVVDGHVLLYGSRDRGIVNDDRGLPAQGVHHQFQHIEEFTGIAPAVAHKRLTFMYLDIFLPEQDILLERTVQQRL